MGWLSLSRLVCNPLCLSLLHLKCGDGWGEICTYKKQGLYLSPASLLQAIAVERERESEWESERNQRGREHDRVGCHSVTSTSKHGVYQAPLLHFHTYTHTNTLADSDYGIYITAEALHILNFSFTFKSIPIQSFVRLTLVSHLCNSKN